MRKIARYMGGLLLFGVAASPVLADPQCKKIHGSIVDAQVVEGCTSPNKFCAEGTVQANHGFNGTTYFRMDGVVRGPATLPGSLATSGILVYTTDRGTLTVRESGLAGLGDDFPALQQVIEGTGDYAGATGHFWVLGHNAGTYFDSGLIGELCLP